MDMTNSVFRRRSFKNARLRKMEKIQLRNQFYTLNVLPFQRNENPEGVQDFKFTSPRWSNFNSPVIANVGFFDNDEDEPTRIQALRIISRSRPLTQNEKNQVHRYYYMQDVKADKDNRYFLNEGYRVSKKLLGLNAKNAEIAVN